MTWTASMILFVSLQNWTKTQTPSADPTPFDGGGKAHVRITKVPITKAQTGAHDQASTHPREDTTSEDAWRENSGGLKSLSVCLSKSPPPSAASRFLPPWRWPLTPIHLNNFRSRCFRPRGVTHPRSCSASSVGGPRTLIRTDYLLRLVESSGGWGG